MAQYLIHFLTLYPVKIAILNMVSHFLLNVFLGIGLVFFVTSGLTLTVAEYVHKNLTQVFYNSLEKIFIK